MKLDFIKNIIFPKRKIVRVIIKKTFNIFVGIAVIFSFMLVYFFVFNVRPNQVLAKVPNWIKTAYSTSSDSYKVLKRKMSDLPYIVYQFKNHEIPTYNLAINEEAWEALDDNLPEPFNADGTRNRLTVEYKVYQEATFKYDGKEYKVKVRYRGDMPEHWSDDKKSWRIDFSKNELFDGKESINLILPENRNFYSEYINEYRAKKFGLKVPKMGFVNLRVNGKMQGVYYMVEQWGKELLEKNELTGDANFYGEKEMYVPIFENIDAWKKYTKDVQNSYSNYAELKKLIDLLENPNDEYFYNHIWDLIDEDTYYAWQVHATLAGSQHQDYHHNVRLYFDNTIGKFIIVPWDVFFFEIESHMAKVNADTPYDYINRNPLNIRILKNIEFLNKRNKLLWDYLKNKDNLKDDLKEYDKIYNKTRVSFYRDGKKIYSNKKYDILIDAYREIIEGNFNVLRKAFKDGEILSKIVVNKNYDKGERIPIIFDLDIKSYGALKISDIEFDASEFKNYPDLMVYLDSNKDEKVNDKDLLIGKMVYDKEKKQYQYKELKNVNLYTKRIWESDDEGEGAPPIHQVGLEETNFKILVVSTNYNIPEIKNPKEIKLTIKSSISDEKIKPKDKVYINGNEFTYFEDKSLSKNEFLNNYPIFYAGTGNKVYLSGSYLVNKNIIVPSGLELDILPGTSLYFASGISLISYSPVQSIGSASAPIKFTAQNIKNPWGVFAVVAANDTSEFKYTTFEYGGDDYINGAYFSGMLALHSSDGKISYSKFSYATGDDGLNIKNAKGEVIYSTFYKNGFDAIDFDFIKIGKIENNTFIENGNDGIDISGTLADIKNNIITKSGDKCISVGEKSNSLIEKNKLDGCNIGIAVKDLSEPTITDNIIINNITGISVYQKKQIFGGGMPKVGNNTFKDNKKDTEVDSASKIVEYKK